ncbi:hypothetical protein JOM56_009813 [Amanita muscaria]
MMPWRKQVDFLLFLLARFTLSFVLGTCVFLSKPSRTPPLPRHSFARLSMTLQGSRVQCRLQYSMNNMMCLVILLNHPQFERSSQGPEDQSRSNTGRVFRSLYSLLKYGPKDYFLRSDQNNDQDLEERFQVDILKISVMTWVHCMDF